jgi:hypothetical protein
MPLTGLPRVSQNLAARRIQYARTKAIARSIPESAPLPHFAPFRTLPLAHSRIKSSPSNFQWQPKPYEGNVSTSFNLERGALQPRALTAVDNFAADLCLHSAHKSSWQTFCLRDAVKSQIDGGCSAYD